MINSKSSMLVVLAFLVTSVGYPHPGQALLPTRNLVRLSQDDRAVLPQVCGPLQGARAERGRGDVRRPLRAQVHDVTLQGAGDLEQTRGECGAATAIMTARWIWTVPQSLGPRGRRV